MAEPTRKHRALSGPQAQASGTIETRVKSLEERTARIIENSRKQMQNEFERISETVDKLVEAAMNRRIADGSLWGAMDAARAGIGPGGPLSVSQHEAQGEQPNPGELGIREDINEPGHENTVATAGGDQPSGPVGPQSRKAGDQAAATGHANQDPKHAAQHPAGTAATPESPMTKKR